MSLATASVHLEELEDCFLFWAIWKYACGGDKRFRGGWGRPPDIDASTTVQSLLDCDEQRCGFVIRAEKLRAGSQQS